MEFFRIHRDIPFMRHALTFNVISLVTFLLAVIFLATRGLNFGVDFRGGTVIEVAYAHPVDFNRVRAALDKLNLGEFSAQAFGRSDTALIRLPLKDESSAALSDRVMNALKADDPSVTQQRVEFVGPQVGKELYENGALALLLVSFGIVGYLALRFEWRFAVAAIIANLHDVIIILGFFAMFQWEFSLAGACRHPRGAGLLGERVGRHRRPDPRELPQAAQGERPRSDRQRDHEHDVAHDHHPRLTLMMVLSILFFGGETLHHFALALAIGICFGIYSSALVMATLVMWMGVSREDLVKPERKAGSADKVLP